ncbi:MAG: hypothetical protein JNM51_10235 [Bacteroidia bacterium]|nr:hypothetical protein [Bacteroidia bacterium]
MFYKIVKNLIFILVLISIASCESKVEKDIIGTWIIDDIYFYNKPIRDSLLANAFVLKKDKTCELPIIDIKDNHTIKEKGEWSVSEKKGKYSLTIRSTNNLFNGIYNIDTIAKIKDASNGIIFKLKISNNQLEIFCSKIGFVP